MSEVLVLEPFSALGRSLGDFGDGLNLEAAAAVLARNATVYVEGWYGNKALQHEGAMINETFQRTDGRAVARCLADDSLLGHNVLSWLYIQSDSKVKQFAFAMQERQDGLQAALLRDADDLRDGIDAALRGDDLVYQSHETVRQRAVESVQRLGLLALNSLESGRRSARAGIDVGDDGGAKLIYMSNLYDDPEHFEGIGTEYRRTSVHEGLHAGLADSGAGFVGGLVDDNEILLLEEIGVEHVARSAVYGGFGKFSRMNLPGGIGSYSYEQALFSILAECGSQPISAALLAEAQAGPRSAQGRGSARKQLHDSLQANVAEILPDYGERGFYGVSTDYMAMHPSARQNYMISVLKVACENTGITMPLNRAAQVLELPATLL